MKTRYWDTELGITPWRILKWQVRHRYKGWRAEREIRPGDIYEDCFYHPVVCTENDRGDLWGVSMIDGTGPRGCSMFHCGPVKLTMKQALQIKKEWPNHATQS